VPQENFHITLHFFGEIEQPNIIIKKIEEAVFDISSFKLYSLGADLFLNNKIVLYIYFRREKKLEVLTSNIYKVFQLEEKKKFIPHLAFGRSRVLSKQQYINLKKKLHRLPIEIDFSVNTIYLFQSIIIQGKPIYKKVASFSLIKQNRS
jgi:2'-5' RNA ligase